MTILHKPILVRESVGMLLENNRKLFIDTTLGSGGHTRALFDAAEIPIQILGIDKDQEALDLARGRLKGEEGVTILHGDFANLDEAVERWGVSKRVDGIIADLGQASFQINQPNRGFSYQLNGPLDLRYDRTSGKTAAEVINRYSQTELTEIIYRYGQESRAKRIAAAIVRNRPLYRTTELAEVIRKACPGAHIYKVLSIIFNVLRVEVNDELSSIKELMPQAFGFLKPGGRMVVLSYDSNQDRIVKKFFREKSRKCICPPELPVCICNYKPELKILTHHVIKPCKEEIEANPNARSARMRAMEKL
ncbi:MAG: 16S rRNA (cytosine(1402)-N(4))-methyltransferase RsmH [Candidatus Hatepunaea meridiana]|nr:16S rRNA (cytosine(1402)-N(4))-methyltransferase RsmH [Candidatus Hatepunaea meridiana]